MEYAAILVPMLYVYTYIHIYIHTYISYRPQRQSMITNPYIAGVSEELRRVCGDYDVRVAFKTGKALRSKLTRVKDPLPWRSRPWWYTGSIAHVGKCTLGKPFGGWSGD